MTESSITEISNGVTTVIATAQHVTNPESFKTSARRAINRGGKRKQQKKTPPA
jgi:hypothetical protein